MSGQKIDYVVLSLSQLDLLIPYEHSSGLIVYEQIPSLEFPCRQFTVMCLVKHCAECRSDPGNQLLRTKWFCNIIICTQIESLHLILLIRSRRENYDRREIRLSYLCEERYTILIRESEIKYNYVRPMRRIHHKSTPAGCGYDRLIAICLHQGIQQIVDILFIFYYQDFVFVIAHP